MLTRGGGLNQQHDRSSSDDNQREKAGRLGRARDRIEQARAVAVGLEGLRLFTAVFLATRLSSANDLCYRLRHGVRSGGDARSGLPGSRSRVRPSRSSLALSSMACPSRSSWVSPSLREGE